MTTTTRNEAAERLRETLREDSWAEDALAMVQLDDALAAERRATVERIRERFDLHPPIGSVARTFIADILDEEAAR